MSENKKSKKKSRRSFIHQASGALGVVAVTAAGWPLVDQMNPSKDVEALATIEVDISGLSEGQSKTVLWRGKPLFIKHRSQNEIDEAKSVIIEELAHPENDDERTASDITVGYTLGDNASLSYRMITDDMGGSEDTNYNYLTLTIGL